MLDDTDYAGQRKAYVLKVRNSFEQENAVDADRQPVPKSKGVRLRMAVSLLLFLLFFAWYDSGSKIQGILPVKVMDLIEDNRYDTILQEALAVAETHLGGNTVHSFP